jgi:hypothetical protein
MNLQEYERRVVDTTKDDWIVTEITKKGEPLDIEPKTHGVHASLRDDLSIGIAWGIPRDSNFEENWVNQLIKPRASSTFIDFFYNGSIVFRDFYISVDEGRCTLPLPEIKVDAQTSKELYMISRDKYKFFKMRDSLEQVSEFDDYFDRVGFKIVDTPWMTMILR